MNSVIHEQPFSNSPTGHRRRQRPTSRPLHALRKPHQSLIVDGSHRSPRVASYVLGSLHVAFLQGRCYGRDKLPRIDFRQAQIDNQLDAKGQPDDKRNGYPAHKEGRTLDELYLQFLVQPSARRATRGRDLNGQGRGRHQSGCRLFLRRQRQAASQSQQHSHSNNYQQLLYHVLRLSRWNAKRASTCRNKSISFLHFSPPRPLPTHAFAFRINKL